MSSKVIAKQPKNATIARYAELAQSLAIDVALYKAWYGDLPPDLTKNVQTRLNKGPIMPTAQAANEFIKTAIRDAVAEEKFKRATAPVSEDVGGEE